MGKYLKSYKQYPAGTIVVIKKYSLWKRFVKWITKKRREYNTIFILPKKSGLGVSKVDLLINDYYLFIPYIPYNTKEIRKLQTLINSCSSIEDYLVTINAIRPDTVNTECLDDLKYNSNFRKIYLDNEPFFEINKNDYTETNKYLHEASK